MGSRLPVRASCPQPGPCAAARTSRSDGPNSRPLRARTKLEEQDDGSSVISVSRGNARLEITSQLEPRRRARTPSQPPQRDHKRLRQHLHRRFLARRAESDASSAGRASARTITDSRRSARHQPHQSDGAEQDPEHVAMCRRHHLQRAPLTARSVELFCGNPAAAESATSTSGAAPRQHSPARSSGGFSGRCPESETAAKFWIDRT